MLTPDSIVQGALEKVQLWRVGRILLQLLLGPAKAH